MMVGSPFRGESLTFKVNYEEFVYTVTYSTGTVKVIDLTNDTIMLCYTAARVIHSSDGEQTTDLDNLFGDAVIVESM
ncbi:unnamed protein product [Strongylus vulgaris]|uniref:Uncharacterized protein n=1 Tax=Strongylus vulgaris TaxID=40348 RepID=A0A3P7JUL6_STRVU|nr:unnamed protein product [Strongylus vulgaris]